MKFSFSTPKLDNWEILDFKHKFVTRTFDYGNSFFIGIDSGFGLTGFFVGKADSTKSIAKMLIRTGFNLLRKKPKIIITKQTYELHLGLIKDIQKDLNDLSTM